MFFGTLSVLILDWFDLGNVTKASVPKILEIILAAIWVRESKSISESLIFRRKFDANSMRKYPPNGAQKPPQNGPQRRTPHGICASLFSMNSEFRWGIHYKSAKAENEGKNMKKWNS